MATIAEKIVTEARSWKSTPFLHQGRLKFKGVDCAGFIGEVANNVGIKVDIPHDYRPREDGAVMMRLLSQHLDFVPPDEVQAGDILALCDEALRDPDIPRHLAFVSEVKPHTMFIIHADRMGVVEHRTNLRWRLRIHSVWRVKDAGRTKSKVSGSRRKKAR